MATVAQILLKMAQHLRPVYYGTTSVDGSIVTTMDADRGESADYFNGGTIFFIGGTHSGKTRKVTDFAPGMITHETVGTDVLDGQDYAVIDKKYTRHTLVAAINSALDELGPFVQTNESLVTVADQETYTLPAGVSNVLRVEIATSATTPFLWEQPYRFWTERDGELHLADNRLPETADMPMRLYYLCAHDRVSLDADVINPDADADLVAVLAALHAARNKAQLAGSSDPTPGTAMQMLAGQYGLLRVQRPVRKMQKDSRLPALPVSRRW